MFEGFTLLQKETPGARINLRAGGEGPPLLLLHGYPQTHAMWHRVAPRLAREFTVICADLRGYGDSSKPASDDGHLAYSKRAMADDMVAVMESLGYDQFLVAGHDRGGRVGHRMALDHGERVRKLAVLDIAPTRKVYETADRRLATAYFHWFFLIQPYDLPERLIGSDPDLWIRRLMSRTPGGLAAFSDEAMSEYLRCFRDAATIHASCEDYRAAATVDLEHDEADGDRKVSCPLLVLWGKLGVVETLYEPLAVWRERATDVSGRALACGHFLPEEAADATHDSLLAFLRD